MLSILISLVYILFTRNYLFALLCLISSVIIDIDHYILYAVFRKDLSIVKAYKLIEKMDRNEIPDKNKGKLPLIFHSIEFVAIISLLSFYFPFMIPVTAGVIFHFITDIITLGPYSFRNIFSLIYYFTKRYKELF